MLYSQHVAHRSMRNFNAPQLKNMCADRGISVTGNKDVLMKRLVLDVSDIYDIGNKSMDELITLCHDLDLSVLGENPSETRIRSHLLGHLVLCGFTKAARMLPKKQSPKLFYVTTTGINDNVVAFVTKNKNKAFHLAAVREGFVMAFVQEEAAHYYATDILEGWFGSDDNGGSGAHFADEEARRLIYVDGDSTDGSTEETDNEQDQDAYTEGTGGGEGEESGDEEYDTDDYEEETEEADTGEDTEDEEQNNGAELSEGEDEEFIPPRKRKTLQVSLPATMELRSGSRQKVSKS